MSFGKIKRRQADVLFSKYLRKLRNYTCEMCFRYFPDGHGLEASHFWGRRYEAARFDEENVDVFCVGCHRKMGEEPATYTDWKRNRMGEQAFKLLDVRAHQLKKRDDKIVILTVKALLQDLE